ncbi:MAG: SDR family oxidoreductase [Pseudomonadota bacterium]
MRSIQELSDMQGRVVSISGGAGHLGTAMAEALLEAGASVVLLDVSDELLDRATHLLSKRCDSHGRIMTTVTDLADRASIDAAIERIAEEHAKMDVLINCAAMVGSASLKGWVSSFEEQDYDVWTHAVNVNLTGAFYLIQKSLPLLRKSVAASVINVSSIYGCYGQKMSMYEGMEYVTPAAYAASKGGLAQMTRYLATVLAPDIRVNCISPGGIERGQNSQFVERYEKATPLNRMGREEDFKGITHFLATDLSAYVTGQNIVVDGGWGV